MANSKDSFKGTSTTDHVSTASLPPDDGRLPSGSGLPPTGRFPVTGPDAGGRGDVDAAANDASTKGSDDDPSVGTATGGETTGPGGAPSLTATVGETLDLHGENPVGS